MLNAHRPGGQPDPAAEGRGQHARQYAIDFVNLEQVAPIANPDPARYAVPTGFAPPGRAERARPGADGHHRHARRRLPAGRRLQPRGRSSRCTARRSASSAPGRGTPGSTHRPARRTPTSASALQAARERLDVQRLRLSSATTRRGTTGRARCSTPRNVTNITIDNIWVEHMVCLFWGANIDNMTIREHADPQHVRRRRQHDQRQHRATWSPTTSPGPPATTASRCSPRPTPAPASRHGNVFENLTSTLTWRAAGIAVYGGYDNMFRNIYIADTLVYSGHHDQLARLRVPDERVRRQPADPVREHLDRARRRPLLGRADVPGASGCSRRRRCSRASGCPMWTSSTRRTAASCSRPTTSARAAVPGHRHGVHEHLDLRRATQR